MLYFYCFSLLCKHSANQVVEPFVINVVFILNAVAVKMSVLWVLTPRVVKGRYQRFGETCLFHFQG